MKQLLLNIQSHLNTACPFLKFIDFDEGQLDYYAERPPVAFPCVLIDFIGADYQDIGTDRNQKPSNPQTGTATIVITIADLKLSNSSAQAPDLQKDKALKILDHIDEVHSVLHSWTPLSGQGKLLRTSTRKQQRDDNIKVWQLTYSVGLR